RAAPAARSVEVVTVRIGHLGSVDVDRVVMETFVERPRVAGPRAVLAFREGAAVLEAHSDALRLGRNDAEFDPALRVDLRILFALLIGWCRLPVVDGLI